MERDEILEKYRREGVDALLAAKEFVVSTDAAAFTAPSSAPRIAFIVFFRTPSEHCYLCEDRFSDFPCINGVFYTLTG